MNKKYYIYTWGCQMNVADSGRIAGYYSLRGYCPAKSAKEADVIIFTTCSVRKSAEDRVRGLIFNISREIKKYPKNPKLILTGCMLHYGEEKLRTIFPTVSEFISISEFGFDLPQITTNKKTALIPISTGCNSFCTYCIVPLARGREKSRPIKVIMAEVAKAMDEGFEEVFLLGQNVNSYGLEKVGMSLRKRLDLNREIPSPQTQYRSFSGKPPFVILLEKICRLEKVKKVSFISSNPWDFYEEIIDCMAKNSKISRTLHLPVQSGSNDILQKMNRGYTREQYLELIKRIKSKIPQIELTTDIIVGFPGETKANFEETVDLCKQVGFAVAFIGRYSPRPGTVSAKTMIDDVSDLEKKQRWLELDRLINHK